MTYSVETEACLWFHELTEAIATINKSKIIDETCQLYGISKIVLLKALGTDRNKEFYEEQENLRSMFRVFREKDSDDEEDVKKDN